MDQHIEPIKHVIDLAGLAVVAGTIWGEMPNIAAFLAVLWYFARFVDWGTQKIRAWQAAR